MPDSKVEARGGEGRGCGPGSQGAGVFPTDGTMPGRDGPGPSRALQAWEPLRVKLPLMRRISLEPSVGTKVPPRLETGRVWALLMMSQFQTQLSLWLSAGLGPAARLCSCGRFPGVVRENSWTPGSTPSLTSLRQSRSFQEDALPTQRTATLPHINRYAEQRGFYESHYFHMKQEGLDLPTSRDSN